MLKIGLTGGIGSGKSTVAECFSILGIPILKADLLAKQIMHDNEEVKQQIIANFGEQAYLNGAINNTYVANIVFKDPYQLSVLNSIVHPATIIAGDIWAKQQDSPYIIKEAAILFESGTAHGMDGIIGVQAPLPLRIQRVMKRDGLNRDQVLSRINQQIDESLKMKLCDWVIVNNEIEMIIPQVLQLHQKLLSLAD